MFCGNKFYLLTQTPIISSAVIIRDKKYSDEELKLMLINSSIESPNFSYPELLSFREDSFDPTTRIRRGRFYQLSKGNPFQNPEFIFNFSSSFINKRTLYTYDPHMSDLNKNV